MFPHDGRKQQRICAEDHLREMWWIVSSTLYSGMVVSIYYNCHLRYLSSLAKREKKRSTCITPSRVTCMCVSLSSRAKRREVGSSTLSLVVVCGLSHEHKGCNTLFLRRGIITERRGGMNTLRYMMTPPPSLLLRRGASNAEFVVVGMLLLLVLRNWSVSTTTTREVWVYFWVRGPFLLGL